MVTNRLHHSPTKLTAYELRCASIEQSIGVRAERGFGQQVGVRVGVYRVAGVEMPTIKTDRNKNIINQLVMLPYSVGFIDKFRRRRLNTLHWEHAEVCIVFSAVKWVSW